MRVRNLFASGLAVCVVAACSQSNTEASLDDATLAGMLLENSPVHIVSGEDAMHLLVTDQGVLLEHSYPSWPMRVSR